MVRKANTKAFEEYDRIYEKLNTVKQKFGSSMVYARNGQEKEKK